jgi:hypothetical protein
MKTVLYDAKERKRGEDLFRSSLVDILCPQYEFVDRKGSNKIFWTPVPEYSGQSRMHFISYSFVSMVLKKGWFKNKKEEDKVHVSVAIYHSHRSDGRATQAVVIVGEIADQERIISDLSLCFEKLAYLFLDGILLADALSQKLTIFKGPESDEKTFKNIVFLRN